MATVRSLRRARDFQRVYRSGRRATRDGVTIIAAAGVPGEASRVGLAVPARVGSAVVRNRVRRRLREAARRCVPPAGCDLVVRAAPELVGRNFQEIVSDMEAALAAARVARGGPA
jgi:ribonuclease P protein component